MADFATSTHPAVQAQLDRLATLSSGGDRLGLERIAELLDRLGRPQDALPPVFHVAGTNGKGSTCAFLRAALEASDRTVHMFTSPHLVRFNERIRIAGRLVEDEVLARVLEEVLDVSEGVDPSFFEVTTAAAFLAFARTPADACIVEVGLGGRLDATNVIEHPLVAGITNLAIDHQQYLGRRMVDIAGEKAGIAKAGAPLVTQLYPPAIAGRIGQIADVAGAQWLPRGGEWDATASRGKLRYRDRSGTLDLPLPRLPGRHQAMNAALAVAMLRHQDKLPMPATALNAAMGWADWPARMQRLGPGPLTASLPQGSELWVDGGHNPSAARAIAAYARRHFAPDLPLVLVFASLTSKDPKGTLEPFQGIAVEVHTVPIGDHEFRDPEELAALARTMGFAAAAHATLDQALSAITPPARVLVFGSLYLAGQALAANGVFPD
jgi:dihydrofolate synthase/folylpolyglutamate synthase